MARRNVTAGTCAMACAGNDRRTIWRTRSHRRSRSRSGGHDFFNANARIHLLKCVHLAQIVGRPFREQQSVNLRRRCGDSAARQRRCRCDGKSEVGATLPNRRDFPGSEYRAARRRYRARAVSETEGAAVLSEAALKTDGGAPRSERERHLHDRDVGRAGRRVPRTA